MRRTVLEVVPEVDPESISMERTLAELGCNSIDRADIVTMVIEELSLQVPVGEFQQGQDIGTLVRLLRRHS